MKLQTASCVLTMAAAAILSFVPACTEVHNDAPARGGSVESHETTRREQSTVNTPVGTYQEEHKEEIRR